MNSTVPPLFVDDLAWDMKGPCNDCPFRRGAPDHAGVVANLINIVDSIEDKRFAHTCHKTDNRADGPKNYAGKVQHCGGALHFIVRAKVDLQLPLLNAAEAGKIDIHELTSRVKKDESVFGSVGELIRYYAAKASHRLLKHVKKVGGAS